MRNAAFLLSLTFCAGTAGADTGASLAPLPGDPVLDRLIRDSVAALPELREARARARAERERAPQAAALPDPVLSLGIQNDGFDSIEIGTMETSFLSIGLSQQLPWPGKRALRARAAELGASQVVESANRVRLQLEAEVRRGYLDLLLVRERMALLDRLAELWERSEALARSRYEVGNAPQSDILRAQLERTRLQQRRFALEAEARTSLEALNRLRNRPLDQPIATTTQVRDLADPAAPSLADEIADAESRSPELRAARIGTRRAEARLDLARKERLPDFGISGAVMERGGLEPMWQVGVSVNLPFLWGRAPRQAAIAGARTAADADQRSAEAVAQVLRQRVGERRAALVALLQMLRLYRDGLLVQSRATVDSTLAQYRVGRVTLASVLEAIGGNIADEDAYLQSIVAAQRIAIARAEVSLDPTRASASAGMASRGVPGAPAAGAGMKSGGGDASAQAEATAAQPSAAAGM
jgi:outer membrane protein, heavy metal efflux system